ncbi:MAG: Ig-like domain-containing protein [Tidjanibacter sp.]|nr:Ig-like domain-containing protein [Tidjanibacter sp.]
MKMIYDRICASRVAALMLTVLAALSLSGCNNDEPKETIIPKIIGQSIITNDKNVSVEPRSIVILFNRDVVVGKSDAISFDPEVEFETETKDNALKINTLHPLQYATTYQLTIGQGAVCDKETKGENTPRTITFSTEKGPYVPPTEPTMKLVSDGASYEAQELYTFLWGIYGGATLSAAMAGANGWDLAECEWIYKWTGNYPAIAAVDYSYLHLSPNKNIDYRVTTHLEGWWGQGGIVAANWNWMVPNSESGRTFTTEAERTDFDITNIVDTKSWEYGVVMSNLKEMADMLLLLKEANIPVMWRPIPSASSKTSWWGEGGAEPYILLWTMMFDYFTERGLNNLIWVWSSLLGDIDFYPGEEYVDMVSISIFNKVHPAEVANYHTNLKSLFPHKMVALADVGNLPSIPMQMDAGAEWSYVMPRYDELNDFSENYRHAYAPISWWRESMADPRVLTRKDLTRIKRLAQRSKLSAQ